MRRVSPVPLALGLAYALFARTFRGPRAEFWSRMTQNGLVLGGLAVAANAKPWAPRLRLRDVVVGLASAAGLYGVFQIGDRLARYLLPGGASDIQAIYSLRPLRTDAELAARLAGIIAPSEELFWRGVLQERFGRAFGPWRGAALATAAYGGAHAVSGNLTLVGAATVAGGYWSLLRARGVSMPALIVSHIAWDVWIFLVAPTSRPTE